MYNYVNICLTVVYRYYFINKNQNMIDETHFNVVWKMNYVCKVKHVWKSHLQTQKQNKWESSEECPKLPEPVNNRYRLKKQSLKVVSLPNKHHFYIKYNFQSANPSVSPSVSTLGLAAFVEGRHRFIS